MADEKKFLDQKGVQYLWSKVSLEDYPNNETLIAVLNAIDQTKADKEEVDKQIAVMNDRVVATDDGELTNALPDVFGGRTADEYALKSDLENVSGLPAGSKPNQYIVTDGEGNAKWEDNPHSVGVVVEKTITTKAGTDYIWSGSMYGVTAYFLPIFMGESEKYETKRVFSLIEGETYIFTDMDGVEHTAIAQRQGDVVVAAGSDRSFMFSDYGVSRAAIMFLGSAETGLNANAYSFSGKFLQKEVDTDPGVTVGLTFDEGGLCRAEINGRRDQGQIDTIAILIYNMGYSYTKITAFWECRADNAYQDVMLLKLYFSGVSNHVLEEMWVDIWGYGSSFDTLGTQRVYIYGEGAGEPE